MRIHRLIELQDCSLRSLQDDGVKNSLRIVGARVARGNDNRTGAERHLVLFRGPLLDQQLDLVAFEDLRLTAEFPGLLAVFGREKRFEGLQPRIVLRLLMSPA